MKWRNLTMKKMDQVARTVLGTVGSSILKKVLPLTLAILHYNVQQLKCLTSCSY